MLQVRELGPELLADARSRLLTGLKRYFHSKRLEGLLSAQASPSDIVHVHTYSMLAWLSSRAALKQPICESMQLSQSSCNVSLRICPCTVSEHGHQLHISV